MSPNPLAQCLTRLLSGVIAFSPVISRAQPTAPVLTVRPAVEISMPTEPGKVYQMQASPDLTSWENRGEPTFGTGTPIVQPMAGGSSQYFRLQVLTAPVMGMAPWGLEGTALQFNEGPRTVRYDFMAAGQGHLASGITQRNIAWTWRRDGMKSGLIEINPADGSREVLRLNYSAAGLGQFIRKTYIGPRLDNADSGSFGPAPAATTLLVPATVAGRTLAFSDLPGGNSLTLTGPNAGVRLLDGASQPFSGNWLVTGINSARLTASFGVAHGEDYRFTFTGPLTGRYTRQTFTEGVFRDDDQGTFCIGPPT